MTRSKAEQDKHDRKTKLLKRLDCWRQIYDGNIQNYDEEALRKVCRESGVILWDDEANDDEKLKEACREADIELVEDHVGILDPRHPVIVLATEIAFNPRFTEVAHALRQLREELKTVGVCSRATLDLL